MPIEPPQMPPGVVLSEKQKTAQRIVTHVLGMVQSQWNIVLFSNPKKDILWVQYYVGLAMQMPTIIIIKKEHHAYQEQLKHPLVKAFFEVTAFTEAESSHMAEKVARYIKQHPYTKV